jgi:uncharacterized protein
MSFLAVKVFPGSGKKIIVRKDDGSIEVRFPAIPEKGKANKAAIDMVAEFLNISSSRIKIIKGVRGRKKLFSIDD